MSSTASTDRFLCPNAMLLLEVLLQIADEIRDGFRDSGIEVLRHMSLRDVLELMSNNKPETWFLMQTEPGVFRWVIKEMLVAG